MTSTADTRGQRVLDNVVLGITGVFLLGLFVAFERFLAGSWRHLASIMTAMGVFYGGIAVFYLLWRGRDGTAPARWPVALLVPLGAAAGAAYSAIQIGRVQPDPLAWGSVVGLISAVNVARQRRHKAAKSQPAEA